MPYGIFQEAFALVLDSVPAEDGRAVGMSASLLLSLLLLLLLSAMMIIMVLSMANDGVKKVMISCYNIGYEIRAW
jgi:hypothetical protein